MESKILFSLAIICLFLSMVNSICLFLRMTKKQKPQISIPKIKGNFTLSNWYLEKETGGEDELILTVRLKRELSNHYINVEALFKAITDQLNGKISW